MVGRWPTSTPHRRRAQPPTSRTIPAWNGRILDGPCTPLHEDPNQWCNNHCAGDEPTRLGGDIDGPGQLPHIELPTDVDGPGSYEECPLALLGPCGERINFSENAGTEAGGGTAEPDVFITDDRIAHILANHGPGVQDEARARGLDDTPGEFYEDFIYDDRDEIAIGRRLVEGASGRADMVNPNGGGTLRHAQFGEDVGVDGFGRPTSRVEVVRLPSGEIWTAFPK